MKQKYTLTVANSQIHIATDATKEEIDAIVGIVDRRIREIHLHSRSCSRTDAAVLLCLDYCAEKIELQKTIKSMNSQVERLTLLNESAQKEIASLEREIETLRQSLSLGNVHKAKKSADTQIGFDDISGDVLPEIKEEEKIIEVEAEAEVKSDAEVTRETVEPAPETAIEKILADEPDTAEEKEASIEEPTHEEHEKPHVKARKKKVRAMFDMISFDDI